MFFHLFKYRILTLLNDKSGVFWLILFPVALSIFFSLAFGNIENDGSGNIDYSFEKIAVAFTGETNEMLNTAAEESEMFVITYTTAEAADELLSTGKIKAIVNVSDKITMTVTESAMDQSIVKVFLDSYTRTNQTVLNIVSQNPEVLTNGFMDNLDEHISKNYLTAKTESKGSNMVIYYYSLLSMAALMGACLAVSDITNLQANQSTLAARVSVSPTKKLMAAASTLCATLVFHWLTSFVIAFGFMSVILKIDFGDNVLAIALLMLVSDFMSIMLGAFLSVLIKKREVAKTGIIIGVTLFSCFLSGMMSMAIKTLIAQNAPIIELINPSSLIVNAMTSLYYYGGTNGIYFRNIIILACIGIAALTGTALLLRRQNYKSI